MMNKPEISPDFTLDDIRKLRQYNDERRKKMTPSELSDDIREGAKEGYRIIEELKSKAKTARFNS